jgi:hypothetical protein
MMPIKPIQNAQFPQEVYQHLNHMINVMLPHISKVTPAMRGLSEGSGESGYLYRQMKMQADMQIYTIHAGLRQFWNEVYEAYLMQAAQTYSNEGLERKFQYNGGRDSVTLNERVVDENGYVIGVRNDVSLLKNIRHKVIIGDTQQSPTQKMELLALITEFIKSIPPGKPATINYMMSKAVQMIDQFDSKDREALDAIGQKELQHSLTEIDLDTMKMKAELQNLQKPPSEPPPPPPKIAITLPLKDMDMATRQKAEKLAGIGPDEVPQQDSEAPTMGAEQPIGAPPVQPTPPAPQGASQIPQSQTPIEAGGQNG